MKRSLNVRSHELQRPNYREIQTANSNYIDFRLYEMEAEKNLHLSEILTLYERNLKRKQSLFWTAINPRTRIEGTVTWEKEPMPRPLVSSFLDQNPLHLLFSRFQNVVTSKISTSYREQSLSKLQRYGWYRSLFQHHTPWLLKHVVLSILVKSLCLQEEVHFNILERTALPRLGFQHCYITKE